MNLAELKRRSAQAVRLWRDRRGQDLIEYALLAAAVALLVYGALPSNYAANLSSIWSRVNDQLIASQRYHR